MTAGAWVPISPADIPEPRPGGYRPDAGWFREVLAGQPVFVADLDPREAHGGRRIGQARELGLRIRTRRMTWHGALGTAVWTEPASIRGADRARLDPSDRRRTTIGIPGQPASGAG